MSRLASALAGGRAFEAGAVLALLALGLVARVTLRRQSALRRPKHARPS